MTKDELGQFPADVRSLLSTAAHVWEDIYNAALYASRMLLYGPPGTGKSRLGFVMSHKRKSPFERLIVTPESCWAEMRGHYGLTASGMAWIDGPCARAWKTGAVALIDEIDQAGGDLIPGLHAFCDDAGTARMVMPNGEVITPKDGFRVIATMNALPRALPEALCDRFVVKREVPAPDPRFLLSLPLKIRAAAAYAMFAKQGSYTQLRGRSWVEIGTLVDRDGLTVEKACEVLVGLGRLGRDLSTAIDIAHKKATDAAALQR